MIVIAPFVILALAPCVLSRAIYVTTASSIQCSRTNLSLSDTTPPYHVSFVSAVNPCNSTSLANYDDVDGLTTDAYLGIPEEVAVIAHVVDTKGVELYFDTDSTKSNFGDASISSVGVFLQVGDDVHISSTPPATASGHGWWVRLSGDSKKAKVTVYLEAKNHNGDWKTVATGSKTVGPGGGSSNRATARKECTNINRYTSWRSLIDVDIIGSLDTPGKARTRTVDFFCDAF